MTMQYQGLVTWITGGGTGIGRAMAIEIAKQGGIVILSGRRADRLSEVKTTIISMGGQADIWVCDVTQQERLEQITEEIVKKYGRLDVCIANAGFSVYGIFEKTTQEEWRRQMEINFFGVVWTTKAALPYLKKSRGRLAIISSVAGKLGAARVSAYCASKFALVGLCNSIYQEFKPLGVSVTNILPGFIESEIINVGNDGVYQKAVDKRPKKLIWGATKAAIPIVSAIHRRKREAVITGHGKIAVFLGQHLPGLTYWAMARKASEDLY